MSGNYGDSAEVGSRSLEASLGSLLAGGVLGDGGSDVFIFDGNKMATSHTGTEKDNGEVGE